MKWFILKKINIVKNNYDFDRIIKNNKPFVYKDFLIYKEISNNNYHFGISISKHICNAVGRNKLKRQIRSIIDQYDYKQNFNCIIIARKSILYSNYKELQEQLNFCFNKLNILKENNDEK